MEFQDWNYYQLLGAPKPRKMIRLLLPTTRNLLVDETPAGRRHDTGIGYHAVIGFMQ